ncbi:prm2p [Saccharomyces arboricola H-6]|uniref:Prm2p n=1 Tax=Saccharomyces arboricola (strain H-6 / AS 2.3317 / CBS 10644) TaxID=1160507 RepID=J8PMF4_SACAR|nr:prm2p [Saccharomyces arboricola H-6]
MDNVRIIRPLSLPQRLFKCLFHPLLLIFFTSIIITIWSTFSVIDITMTKTSRIETVRNDTVTTFVSVSTTTTTASRTSVVTYQPTYSANIYSLNNTFVDQTLDRYIESKVLNIASVVDTDMQETFQSYANDLLDDKQQLITDEISLEIESTKSVLELNNTIFNELLTKSQLINQTWNEISEYALTIDEDSISQMASNLLLNYSMFDNVFQNYSSRLAFLQEFNDTIIDFPIQLGTNKTLHWEFLQNSTTWVKLKKDFITNLQNKISVLSRNTTDDKPSTSTSITKRSLKANGGDDDGLRKVKKRIFCICQKMTIILAVVYFALVVLLMVMERIIFQLENQQINLVISHINGLTGCTNFTHYNKVLKSLITTLNLCLLYPVSYHLTKLINQRIQKKGPKEIDGNKAKRSKIFYFNWWIFSNGVHLWLFGLIMLLIHWQIVAQLTSFEVPNLSSLEKREEPSLYKREVWTDANMTTAVEDLINDNISLLCENFQLEVNKGLLPTNQTLQADPSLKNQTMEILSFWVNDTNTQFEKYLNESSSHWQEIDIEIGPLISTDSITKFINQYSIPMNKVSKTNASFASDIQKYGIIIQETNKSNTSVARLSPPAKRHVEQNEQRTASSLHTVYKWGLLIICVAILFHHLLTFIILKL